MTLDTSAERLFAASFGRNRGRAGDNLTFVAGAASTPPPAALFTDGNTVGVDHGAGGGVVAATSPTTRPAVAAAGSGCALRSAASFLQRTAGAIASSFFAASSGSTTTLSRDGNTEKSQGAGYRALSEPVPREKSVWYHASELAPVFTQLPCRRGRGLRTHDSSHC